MEREKRERRHKKKPKEEEKCKTHKHTHTRKHARLHLFSMIFFVFQKDRWRLKSDPCSRGTLRGHVVPNPFFFGLAS